MIHLHGDYYFESDGVHQFTLCKKGIVTGDNPKGKQAKQENIGKTKYVPIGYYSTLESLLNGFVHKSSLEIAALPDVKSVGDLCKKLHDLVDNLTFVLTVDDQTRTVRPSRVKKTSA